MHLLKTEGVINYIESNASTKLQNNKSKFIVNLWYKCGTTTDKCGAV